MARFKTTITAEIDIDAASKGDAMRQVSSSLGSQWDIKKGIVRQFKSGQGWIDV